MTSRQVLTLAAPVLTGAARVALGILWLNEGLLKYRAHFGAADILLVAESAASNARVPDFFKAFTGSALQGFPDFFGFAMPLIETALGVLLILGVFTLPAALASVFTLMSYWLADQLIGQYPIMVLLGVLIVLWPMAASRLSLSTLVERAVRRRRPASVWGRQPIRRWL
ncbi:DoxX family membrane protein [Psychromicrobium sp. YIM B11713]|uniref:DoxX family membrane protein n=1 Tax=Psychromicrobium sp. YIM B11713 TaxID=3145233 RepID=UPI00374F6681